LDQASADVGADFVAIVRWRNNLAFQRIRWNAALNAFAVTFEGRLDPSTTTETPGPDTGNRTVPRRSGDSFLVRPIARLAPPPASGGQRPTVRLIPGEVAAPSGAAQGNACPTGETSPRLRLSLVAIIQPNGDRDIYEIRVELVLRHRDQAFAHRMPSQEDKGRYIWGNSGDPQFRLGYFGRIGK
jgi:hypothetical protein